MFWQSKALHKGLPCSKKSLRIGWIIMTELDTII
jgi:hypothetical protein